MAPPDDLIIARVEAGKLVSGAEFSEPVLWWSFGKTAAAAAVLALVRDGRADLDASVPEGPFSLRQLLQHRAGLPDYGYLPAYQKAVAAGGEPWTDEDFIRWTLKNERVRRPTPGDFAYSNIGYMFVRQFLERTTGKSFGDALQDLLFGPLEITGFRQAVTPGDLLPARWGNAAGYHPGWVATGLLIGPLSSAALFLDRLIMSPLIPAHLLKEMRGSIVVGGPIEGRPFIQPSYGLGVMMDPKAPAGRMVGHTGQGPGSTIAVYRFPDAKPNVTIAVCGPVQDQGMVEWAAVNAVKSPA